MEQKNVPTPKGAEEYFRNKMTYSTGPVELKGMMDRGEDIAILDVRSREDYEKAHVPGAISLPQDEWASVKGLSPNKVNVLYCYSHVCHLAAKAGLEFARKGFPVMEMDGGMKAWKKYDLPLEGSEVGQGPISKLKELAQQALH